MNTKTAKVTDGYRPENLAIDTGNLRFRWPNRGTALAFPDIHLPRGEHLFLQGASGAGKSTLLGLLAGMQTPDSGHLNLLRQDVATLKASKRDRFRADHMGVIFQQFNLVPYLSALSNVLLPCRLSALRHARAIPAPADAARDLLRQLTIPESHWHQSVTRLSIGQQQRVAAARALIGAPEIILADEPTSALDNNNRDRFLELLLSLAAGNNSSVVFVSHDPALARHFHHRLTLEVAA
ncbi:ABC transporter ATP-binding protein [Marinobacter sp. VGCF2001]|uniref:ABC transporter ATP-binding protein n=1 Tax=Marinobacter sp. VGCF2001 TaxID=3417189 RepID=UPI003CE90FF2